MQDQRSYHEDCRPDLSLNFGAAAAAVVAAFSNSFRCQYRAVKSAIFLTLTLACLVGQPEHVVLLDSLPKRFSHFSHTARLTFALTMIGENFDGWFSVERIPPEPLSTRSIAGFSEQEGHCTHGIFPAVAENWTGRAVESGAGIFVDVFWYAR